MVALLFCTTLSERQMLAQGCLPPFDWSYTNMELDDITDTWSAGDRISITGKLTINESVNLDNLYFVMSPDASIEITGSSTVVTAEGGTEFYSCTQQWLGIAVINGATFKFKESTKIKHAWVGLRFSQGANGTDSELEDTRFLNNTHGLAIWGIGSAASPFQFNKFSNNVIEYDNTVGMLTPTTAHPHPGTISSRGIWITTSNVDLSHGAAVQNRVEHCRYGMGVYLSTVLISNIKFRNNSKDPAILGKYDGTDIYSLESALTVAGADNLKCVFESPDYASVVSHSTKALHVSGANFTNPARYGIHCTGSKFIASIEITNNTFHMNNNVDLVSAIYVERPPGDIPSTIRSNTVNVGYTSFHFKNEKVLIDVVGDADAFSFFNVEACALNVNTQVNKIHGIRVAEKGENYRVWNQNTLSYNTATSPTVLYNSLGIIAKDLTGSSHEVTGNSVASSLNGNKSYLNAGIQASNAPFSLKICDNTVSNTHIGLECKNALDNTLVKSNILGSAAYGLLCRDKTTMPEQPRHENRWTGSYATIGAEYQGSPGFRFFYDDDSTIPDDDPPSWSPSGWFEPQDGSSNGACTESATPPVTEREREYIDGTTAADTATANWEARRILLYKLMRYPELLEEDEDAEDYLEDNAADSTSAWKFARAEWLFDQAYALPSPTEAKLENLWTKYRAYVKDLLALDEEQAQDTTDYDYEIAQSQADTFARMCVTMDSLHYELVYADSLIQLALATARSFVQTLPTAKAYESNLKDVLLIAVRSAQGDSLTSTDTTTLRDVAAQCPQYGGMSVFRAPNWLSHEESVSYITKDWVTLCGGERSTQNNNHVNIGSVRVVPNPADDHVQFVFPDNTFNGRWKINDIAGRTMQEGNIADAILNVGISDWKAGLYFFTCQGGNGQVSTVKFAITH